MGAFEVPGICVVHAGGCGTILMVLGSRGCVFILWQFLFIGRWRSVGCLALLLCAEGPLLYTDECYYESLHYRCPKDEGVMDTVDSYFYYSCNGLCVVREDGGEGLVDCWIIVFGHPIVL